MGIEEVVVVAVVGQVDEGDLEEAGAEVPEGVEIAIDLQAVAVGEAVEAVVQMQVAEEDEVQATAAMTADQEADQDREPGREQAAGAGAGATLAHREDVAAGAKPEDAKHIGGSASFGLRLILRSPWAKNLFFLAFRLYY